jgi:acetylornithine deacetylase/succinyl-diaminopimelate desuccinylase-like protein
MALDLNSGGDSRIAPVELLKLAQRRRDDVAAFLQALVRIPSVNGRESESAVAERIAVEANRLGFDAELVAADPARPNILVECGSGGDGFAFIGHMDTVAEGDPAAWAHSPFGGEIDAGRLYGRGSADNKAGIACALYAMALLRGEKLIAPGEVCLTLAAVVDVNQASSPLRGICSTRAAWRRVPSILTPATSCVGHAGCCG